MTNLQDKLKQHGFPEPDEINLLAKYYCEKCILSICHDSESSFVYITRPDTLHNHLGATLCHLKTDSDWQAVANFIKFLKAQND